MKKYMYVAAGLSVFLITLWALVDLRTLHQHWWSHLLSAIGVISGGTAGGLVGYGMELFLQEKFGVTFGKNNNENV